MDEIAKGTGTSRRKLGIALAAVFVPLAALLVVQFFWLSRLERMSALAHEAAIGNYLDAIADASRDHWQQAAERSLDLPARLFTGEGLEKVASFWAERRVAGARRMFLADFTRERTGNFLVWAPESSALETPPASDESLAMIVATASWQMLSLRGGVADDPGVVVDERSSEYRIVLRPVLDDSSRVVGVAGMVLDERWFREVLVPEALAAPLEEYFPKAGKSDLTVRVFDTRGREVLRIGEGKGLPEAAKARIPFVFGDWTVSPHLDRATPGQWAQGSSPTTSTRAG